ncbi:MAG TPA: cytochrome c [Acetobacteraceae bacterium]|nr:cytochrome c [Acetobacteraceae bacterium]
MNVIRRLILWLFAIGCAGMAGFLLLAWRNPIAPRGLSQPLHFPSEQVARGAMLASAGYCATCHTKKNGAIFAGGYAMNTGFGTIYSTNITPDPDTGIGRWTLAAFSRAMREGVAQDGSHLFPAFPYDHFTKLSDEDVAPLYAFFMTRPPVRAPARSNALPFPLNIRLLQEGWKILFFRPGRFKPDPAQSADWNRGAYLAEGLSHCGGCHTPRNLLGAEKKSEAYAGAVIDHWMAPALTDANPTPTPWTQAELHAYLRNGVSALHGSPAGPMVPVVHGLSALPDADVQTIAKFFATIDRAAQREPAASPAVSKAMAVSQRDTQGGVEDPGARLFATACAACHVNAGRPNPKRPELALNSALYLDQPTNLFLTLLGGISARAGINGASMPSYQSMSNPELEQLATYLRASRTDRPPWTDLEEQTELARRSLHQTH